MGRRLKGRVVRLIYVVERLILLIGRVASGLVGSRVGDRTDGFGIDVIGEVSR
ncbi:MAG TPA: hypothetical protein VFR23_00685 [Jiangellaceae bacterium]|nr:hypothetical protein [Jiangellaceae bacterium]